LLKRHKKRKLADDAGNVYEVGDLRNLDMLEDKALIEELIAYNRDGNFDVVMAMMGAIIQLNEHYNEDFLEQYQYDRADISSFLMELYTKKYGSEREKYDVAMKKSKNRLSDRRSVSHEIDDVDSTDLGTDGDDD